MAANPAADRLVNTLRDTTVALVAGDHRNMTARQLAIFLTCYLDEGPHTVRGLAAYLRVPKPAVSCALDRLAEFDLTVRRPERGDRRSIVVARTPKGTAFLRELKTIVTAAPERPAK